MIHDPRRFGRRAASSAGSFTGPSQSARTPPSGVAGASRSSAEPIRARVASTPNASSSSGIGGRIRSTTLSDDMTTTKRSADAATIRSRVCAPPFPLTTQPSAASWSAPSTARSSRLGALLPWKGTTWRPSSTASASVASEVATQTRSRVRAASACTKYVAVEPVPRPIVIPLSASAAAASAASCFSRSRSATSARNSTAPVAVPLASIA